MVQGRLRKRLQGMSCGRFCAAAWKPSRKLRENSFLHASSEITWLCTPLSTIGRKHRNDAKSLQTIMQNEAFRIPVPNTYYESWGVSGGIGSRSVVLGVASELLNCLFVLIGVGEISIYIK